MSTTFTVELPSRGIYYLNEDGQQLLLEGKANLRPMGKQEEALLFQRGGDPVMKIATIVNNCYLDRDKVKAEDLLIVDRFYILFMLRVQMFGPVYEVPFRCSYCGHQRKMKINVMEELEVKQAKDEDIEPFNVDLPHCKQNVAYKLLRGKDEAEIARYTKRFRMQSTDAGDPSNRYRIAKQILQIDGNDVDKTSATKFADTLDMADANEFRLAVEEVECGIDLEIMHDCEGCGATVEFVLPFTIEFLQPGKRSDK